MNEKITETTLSDFCGFLIGQECRCPSAKKYFPITCGICLCNADSNLYFVHKLTCCAS